MALLCPDPEDYRVPDLAWEAGADFVVSGDPHLLAHEIPLPTEIVTPARFLEKLSRRDPGPR